MAIGSLVAIPELQAEGPARLEAQQSGFLTIRFLASGAEMTTEARTVVRYVLLPGTRVHAMLDEDEEVVEIGASAPTNDRESGLLRYSLGGGEETIAEDQILLVPESESPGQRLRTAAFHELRPRFERAGTPMAPEPWGPITLCARETLLAWRDQAWKDTGGVVALAGARVEPLPHQLLTAQRISVKLNDNHLCDGRLHLVRWKIAKLKTSAAIKKLPERAFTVMSGEKAKVCKQRQLCDQGVGALLITQTVDHQIERWPSHGLGGDPFAQRDFVLGIGRGNRIAQLSGLYRTELQNTGEQARNLVNKGNGLYAGGPLWWRLQRIERQARGPNVDHIDTERFGEIGIGIVRFEIEKRDAKVGFGSGID